MSLPHHYIFETCRNIAEEKKYNLRSMQQIEGFFEDVSDLASKFIDNIQFNHILRQKKAEKLENLFQEAQDLQKEEDNETDDEEEEKEEMEGEEDIVEEKIEKSYEDEETKEKEEEEKIEEPKENIKNIISSKKKSIIKIDLHRNSLNIIMEKFQFEKRQSTSSSKIIIFYLYFLRLQKKTNCHRPL